MIYILCFPCLQELEHPLILIHEKKISDMTSLVRILELAVNVIIIILIGYLLPSSFKQVKFMDSDTHLLFFLPFDSKQKNRPLLVVAEDVESDPLSMLILNKHHAGVKVRLDFSC